MRAIDVVGVGSTPFGRQPGSSLSDLGGTAIRAALTDAEVSPSEVDLVVFGNAMAGLLTGQEMIRGQVVASAAGLPGVPVLNTENACATGASALYIAIGAIRSGLHDTVVVCGAESMSVRPAREVRTAMTSAVEIARIPEITRELTGSDEPAQSFFMEVYARITAEYMERSGATAEDFADVAVKNSANGVRNPLAQYRQERTREEVLASRQVAGPLTALMCSPIADGAAALVLRAADRQAARTPAGPTVRVRACALGAGIAGRTGETLERRTALAAYDQAGVGPEDLHVVQVHDAASPNELMMYEELGLCPVGDGPKLLASGDTALGGRVPVNTDGGLTSRGHPVGATGCAQLVELVHQLRGRAGARQADGARIGLAENAGGYLHPDAAACVVTILEAVRS